ncbi:MAG: hypothetical protein HRU38_05875 [Saccharospirillaceae bacterium]|nr:hypothetical protein [Pseudomonadales bacterium]NRB78185.1 hypothetical protein [Saccharospirillaceae bacterium]
MKTLLCSIALLSISTISLAQEDNDPKLLQEYNAIEFGTSFYVDNNSNELDNKIHLEMTRSINDKFYFEIGFTTANSNGSNKTSLNTINYGVGFTEITDFGSGEIDTYVSFSLFNAQDTQTDALTDQTTTTQYMGQKISVGLNTLMNTMPQMVTKLGVNVTNTESQSMNVSYNIGLGYDFHRYLQLVVNAQIGSNNDSTVGIAIRRKF